MADVWQGITLIMSGFVIGLFTGHKLWDWDAQDLNQRLRTRNQQLLEIATHLQEQNEIFRLFNRWDDWKDLNAE